MFFFFFNDTATTEIYTLSLHDALPICLINITGTEAYALSINYCFYFLWSCFFRGCLLRRYLCCRSLSRSEEHTSELQSRQYLVCRLLLEKKKTHFIYLNLAYLSCMQNK